MSRGVAMRDLGVAWRWLPCDVCGSTTSHRVAIATPPEALETADRHSVARLILEDSLDLRPVDNSRTRIVCVDWAACWQRVHTRTLWRAQPMRP